MRSESWISSKVLSIWLCNFVNSCRLSGSSKKLKLSNSVSLTSPVVWFKMVCWPCFKLKNLSVLENSTLPDLAVVIVSVSSSIFEMKTLVATSLSFFFFSMKKTIWFEADSWNWPGATRSMSLRFSNLSFKYCVCVLLHGHAKTASKPMTKITGQQNCQSGFKNLDKLKPLENQMIISLSRYILEKV